MKEARREPKLLLELFNRFRNGRLRNRELARRPGNGASLGDPTNTVPGEERAPCYLTRLTGPASFLPIWPPEHRDRIGAAMCLSSPAPRAFSNILSGCFDSFMSRTLKK